MTELDKQSKTFETRRKLEEFFDWLNKEGIILSEWRQERLFPITINRENLLNNYFGINGAKLEKERRALLEKARETSKKEAIKNDG